MNKYSLLISLIIFTVTFSFAQGPVFQDKAGETSIQTGDNAIFLNSGDASIGLQLSRAERNTVASGSGTSYKPQVEFGGNVKAKATDGVSSVLDQGKLKVAVDVTAFYRRAFRGTPKQPDQNTSWYITGKYSRAQHNILKAGSVDFDSRALSVLQFTVGLSGYDSAPLLRGKNSIGNVINSTFVYGISVGYGGFSNFDNLLPIERFTLLTATGSTSLTTSQSVILKDKKKG